MATPRPSGSEMFAFCPESARACVWGGGKFWFLLLTNDNPEPSPLLTISGLQRSQVVGTHIIQKWQDEMENSALSRERSFAVRLSGK